MGEDSEFRYETEDGVVHRLSNPPTQEEFTEHNLVQCNLFRPHDRFTQVLVPCDPVFEDGWVFLVAVQDLTPEEIAIKKETAILNLKNERNRIFSETDWSQVPDVVTRIGQDKVDALKAYRAAVWQVVEDAKAGVFDPRGDVVWPVNPEYPIPA